MIDRKMKLEWKHCLKHFRFLLFLRTLAEFGVYASCPSDDPSLMPWYPGSSPSKDVVIGHGMKCLLQHSLTLRTLYIEKGGVLVFKDSSKELTLSVKFIHIENEGALRIGSDFCGYQGKANIIFRGRSYDKDFDDECGKKGLCVARGGILEIHGKEKLSWTFLNKPLFRGEYENMLNLDDDASSWEVGDRIVISSTDNDMYQAEEFNLVHCSRCSKKQIKIHGSVKHTHYGGHYKGADMRAEVGIITRNIRIRGDMESHCYGHNWCQYFSYDTFGGHIMFLRGFKRVRLEGIEIENMGQQANLGRYPVHFHDCGDLADKKIYDEIAYVRQLSIHHCYNRCVTVHGTSSLVVQDVVGYDTLGHCFFLEDGNEQNNTFYHNLGLVTQASTLLPSDRNKHMCMAIRKAVWLGHMPEEDECTAVSTFWIAHPNNNFINNAAAGAEEAGFWFIFHERPTGHGPGSLPPFQALRTPMGKFYNNKAHSSNYGVYIDDGVKPSEPSKYKPQEYLSRQMAEYMPHKNADPMKPRVPARIEKLSSFKNNFGLRARGGDIYIYDSYFADNGNSIELSSSKSFPYDLGSHQEVDHSVIIGHSDNGGHWSRRKREVEVNESRNSTNETRNSTEEYTDNFTVSNVDIVHNVSYDSPAGLLTAQHSLTHVANRNTGVDVLQGPVIIKNSAFYDFWSSDTAISFSEHTPGQMSVLSAVSALKFGHDISRFRIGPYPKTDGDKTRILHDEDGTMSGHHDSYVMNKDNWLARHGGCWEHWKHNCAVCKGKFGSLFIRADPERYQKLKIWREESPEKPTNLDGIVLGHRAMQRTEYHPNILRNRGYMLSWGWSLPHDVVIYPVGFDIGDYATIGICIRNMHDFSVFWELERKTCGNTTEIIDTQRYFEASSWEDLHSMRNQFFVDDDAGILLFKVEARYSHSGYNYCSDMGCERLHFTYHGPSPKQNCKWHNYPKHQWMSADGGVVQIKSEATKQTTKSTNTAEIVMSWEENSYQKITQTDREQSYLPSTADLTTAEPETERISRQPEIIRDEEQWHFSKEEEHWHPSKIVSTSATILSTVEPGTEPSWDSQIIEKHVDKTPPPSATTKASMVAGANPGRGGNSKSDKLAIIRDAEARNPYLSGRRIDSMLTATHPGLTNEDTGNPFLTGTTSATAVAAGLGSLKPGKIAKWKSEIIRIAGARNPYLSQRGNLPPITSRSPSTRYWYPDFTVIKSWASSSTQKNPYLPKRS